MEKKCELFFFWYQQELEKKYLLDYVKNKFYMGRIICLGAMRVSLITYFIKTFSNTSLRNVLTDFKQRSNSISTFS